MTQEANVSLPLQALQEGKMMHGTPFGRQVYGEIQSGRFPTIKVINPSLLLTLPSPNAIILASPSGSGDTTVRLKIKEANIPGIEMPHIIRDRDPRPDDIPEEGRSVGVEVFKRMVEEGEIGIHWIKSLKLHGEHLGHHRYGFLKPENKEALPVYVAASAMIVDHGAIDPNQTVQPLNPTLEPSDTLQKALIIQMYARDIVRGERIEERSPGLFQGEKLKEGIWRKTVDRSKWVIPHAHLLVRNFGSHEKQALIDAVNFVRLVAQMK